MLDMATELTAKGAKLPAGAVLGCPIAINDSGSILMAYSAPTSTGGMTYGFARFNAKP
jgi:hypothetical protein